MFTGSNLGIKILGSFFLSCAFLGCTKDKSKPNVELIQDMMVQEHVKPQEEESFFADKQGSRLPPENTKPVGFRPYKFKTDPDGAAKNLRNPLSADFSDSVLKLGSKYYETNCTVCHGMRGDGNGPLKTKYPIPIPSLLSEKVRKWSDGSIYHVITMGQGTMGAYASHIPDKYRWQTVNYIRKLQNTGEVK